MQCDPESVVMDIYPRWRCQGHLAIDRYTLAAGCTTGVTS